MEDTATTAPIEVCEPTLQMEVPKSPKVTPMIKTPKRAIDELVKVHINKLTEPEKNDLLKFYSEENQVLKTRCEMLDQNAQSAYEKVRTLERIHGEFKIRTTAKLNYARQAIEHCRTSIILAATPEE